MRLDACLSMLAWIYLEILRMVFLFFPAMGQIAMVFIGATISVVIDKRPRTPIAALFFRIIIKLRFSSEILPIMWENALISLMICLIVRTPNSFKMKHIKVRILFKSINEFYWNLSCWVGKWAVLSIFAFSSPINIRRAKFGFVFIRMIEFFDPIMRFRASFSIRAFFTFYSIRAHFGLVRTKRPPLVLFLIMVKRASFQIMTTRVNCARMNFKQSQIKKTTERGICSIIVAIVFITSRWIIINLSGSNALTMRIIIVVMMIFVLLVMKVTASSEWVIFFQNRRLGWWNVNVFEGITSSVVLHNISWLRVEWRRILILTF